MAGVAAERGRRRDGTSVTVQVSALASMISANANHCWRTVRNWRNTAIGEVVSVIKASDGSQSFSLAGGRFIKFPTWALKSGVLSRVAIVALLGLCTGLQYKEPTKPVRMTRKSLNRRTGLGGRSITTALDELERAGVITRIKRFSDDTGWRQATDYRINWEKAPIMGAREGTNQGARGNTMGTARDDTNISEVLFSEGLSSDPPPPTSESTHHEKPPNPRGDETSKQQQDEPATAFLNALVNRQGTWSPLIKRARVTTRDRRKINQALGNNDPAESARALDAATHPTSLRNVWRPLSVLAQRLEPVIDELQDRSNRPVWNDKQRHLMSHLQGEILAGEIEGPLEKWMHQVHDLV